jgi:peptide/nickel transport system substrate-binding protein
MKRSNFLIIAMITISLLMGVVSNFSRFNENIGTTFDSNKLKLSQESELVFGVRAALYDLDPHYAWDPYSFSIIEQVCEGLFTYNYSDPSNEIMPRLASDYGTWSIDGLNYTVSVKPNITFHDGTALNASAIKWNFERLLYLMNYTGTLPPELYASRLDMIYSWADDTPFINRTEEIDPFTIRFVLNRPFGAFEALLCFPASYILSPSSTSPINQIDTITGDLIGTGPFMFESYTLDTQVILQANTNYWRAPPEIEALIYDVYHDGTELNNALLDGDIDVLVNPLPSYLEVFNQSANITIVDQKGRSWLSFYIGMNNNHINQTFREAISYAVDYDFIINDLRQGIAERLKSPVPNGVLYSNYSLNYPYLNISHARKVMQSIGFGNSSMTDEEWEAAKFVSFNFTYFNGTSFYRSLFHLLKNNLSRIGIEILDAGLEYWHDFLFMLMDSPPYSRDWLQLFVIYWYPDFNDPSQIINILFNNSTGVGNLNVAQYNGGFGGFEPYNKNDDVQLLMEKAINITDRNERHRIYNKIQKLMLERDYPMVWLYTPKLYVAFNNDLEGFQKNTFCTVNEDDEASLKGDMIYIKWKADTPENGENGPFIPGYSTVIFSVIFLIFIYSIYRRRNKILKFN